jgi:hypothetical protein
MENCGSPPPRSTSISIGFASNPTNPKLWTLANTYGFVHEAWEGVQNFLKQLYEMMGSGTTQSLFAIFSLVANQV